MNKIGPDDFWKKREPHWNAINPKPNAFNPQAKAIKEHIYQCYEYFCKAIKCQEKDRTHFWKSLRSLEFKFEEYRPGGIRMISLGEAAPIKEAIIKKYGDIAKSQFELTDNNNI